MVNDQWPSRKGWYATPASDWGAAPVAPPMAPTGEWGAATSNWG